MKCETCGKEIPRDWADEVAAKVSAGLAQFGYESQMAEMIRAAAPKPAAGPGYAAGWKEGFEDAFKVHSFAPDYEAMAERVWRQWCCGGHATQLSADNKAKIIAVLKGETT